MVIYAIFVFRRGLILIKECSTNKLLSTGSGIVTKFFPLFLERLPATAVIFSNSTVFNESWLIGVIIGFPFSVKK